MARIPPIESDPARHRELTLAVAAQRAEDVHVRQALALLTHTHGRVGIDRALRIYARIHALPSAAERTLVGRVLAALGQADLRPAGDEAREGGLLGRIRRRLRGRRDHELRRWVEFHKGRTDRDLVEVHVDAVARAHRASDGGSVAEIVAWYAEAAQLRGAMRDNVYLAALARLDDTGQTDSEHVLRHPETRRRGGGSGMEDRPDAGVRFRTLGDGAL
ncbi:MAG TPA: hypothetical protein VK837_10490 [Longimicrobiales bacterium]|nr:hypothetical protein [Longimicrobiales bacterium]